MLNKTSKLPLQSEIISVTVHRHNRAVLFAKFLFKCMRAVEFLSRILSTKRCLKFTLHYVGSIGLGRKFYFFKYIYFLLYFLHILIFVNFFGQIVSYYFIQIRKITSLFVLYSWLYLRN